MAQKKGPPSRKRWRAQREGWRLRTLPPGYPGSTIRVTELNYRVRDGIGCVLCTMTTNHQLYAHKALLCPRHICFDDRLCFDDRFMSRDNIL